MKIFSWLLCGACACGSQAAASGPHEGGSPSDASGGDAATGSPGRGRSEPAGGHADNEAESGSDSMPSAGTDDEQHGGAGGMPDSGPIPSISDAWPRDISPGRALMFSGESLTEVESVRLGSVDVPVAYADDSKLVIVAPADTELGPVNVALRFRSQLVPQPLGLHVVPADDVSPNSPTTPIIPTFYDTVSFPPITDQWRNECKFPDLAADQYVFNVDKVEGDELFFSGKIFYFSNFDSDVTGSFSRRTGLVHFENLGSAFVGLFSATDKTYLLRMILFPVIQGNQRVLLGCSQALADEVGAVCPDTTTESTGLSDAPTTCID